MGWRTVIITGNAKLDYKLGYIVVRKKSEIKRVHLSEIGVLMIESTAVSLTTMLLNELVNNKINVIFCDDKHNPTSELNALYGSHDTSAKIREQVVFTPKIKANVWTEIVRNKIQKQSNLLLEIGKIEESKLLRKYTKEIENNDATNREGHAAKVYFNALFGSDFVRGESDSTNAALNYGYSILLSYFNREIISNGYVTQIGLFHDNIFNQFNLSSDLMEPFRVLIDRKVYSIKPKEFNSEEKRQIIDIFNQNVRIAGQIQYVTNSISIYVKSVFEALREENEYLIKFYNDEL